MNAVDAVPLEEEEKNSCASHLVLSGDYFYDIGLHWLRVAKVLTSSTLKFSRKNLQSPEALYSFLAHFLTV